MILRYKIDVLNGSHYRCKGKVFHNERVPTGGKSYHKKCATCVTCEKNIGNKDICNGKETA